MTSGLPALLEFQNISKVCGTGASKVQANNRISFSVQAGSIHALVGENGAGKSTLMKILFGLMHADEGNILLRGKVMNFASPLEAKAAGLGMVHQHFMLAGPISALDHIFLDEKISTSKTPLWLQLLRPLPKKSRRTELDQLSKKYHMPIPWKMPVETLSVGIQQRVEIMKLLYNQAEILILDEPTAVLTPQEIVGLFEQLKELKKNGKTILIITHKLKEVMALADQVTVLRQGQVVTNKKVSDTNIPELSELMVGRKLRELPAMGKTGTRVTYEIKNLSLQKKDKTILNQLNMNLHQSEIVGIAGIDGNGQSELIEVLLDPKRYQSELSGELIWNQVSVLHKNAKHLKDHGLSYFPEDRLRQGVLTDADVEDNFILGQHRSAIFQKSGWFLKKKIADITSREMKEFDVRPGNSKMLFKNLSGGNQQKLVVARELFRRPQLLIAAQPTRGVDIGAIERIHSELLNLKAKGGSVLLISSDLDEVMKLSDRIFVIYHGEFVGELSRQDFNEMTLGRLMAGAH